MNTKNNKIKLILPLFLLAFVVVPVSFAQEEGVVAGAGPAFEETPTPTPTPSVSVSPSATPVMPTATPTPEASDEEVSFLQMLLNSLGLWWLLVLALVIAVSVYLSRKKRSESPTP